MSINVQVSPIPNVNILVGSSGNLLNLSPQGYTLHSNTHISGGIDEVIHNNLRVQGGQNGEYYHLNSGQYFNLTTGDVVRPNETGQFYAASNPSGFITGVDLSAYATIGYVTGASGVLQIQISSLNSATGSYVLDSETGIFITQSETGLFYASNNPSGFITGVDLSTYATTSYVTGASGVLQAQINTLDGATGSYVLDSETGSFVTTGEADNRYVSLSGSQTISGTKTFNNTINANINGNANTVTNGVYRVGDQTINGEKTFIDNVILQRTSNQLQFKTGSAGNTIYITTPVINGNRTYTIPDVGSPAAFVLTSGPQTIGGVKNFTSTPKVNDVSVYLSNNPSGFITGVDLSNYSTISYSTGISGYLQNQISDLNNATGDYVLQNQTGQFYPSSNPSGFYSPDSSDSVIALSLYI